MRCSASATSVAEKDFARVRASAPGSLLELWCCELDGSSGAGAQVCAAAEAGGVLF